MQKRNNDIELAKAAARGDQRACSMIVAEHGQRLLLLVARLVGSSGEAEEVLQDSLLQALRHIDSYDPSRGTLNTSLSTIAWLTALNHLRLHRHPQTIGIEAVEDGWARSTDENMAADEAMFDEAFSTGSSSRVEALTRALQQLTAEERALLQLRYNDELPLGEVAAIVGSDAQTLASRLYRIRKKLYNLILKIEKQ